MEQQKFSVRMASATADRFGVPIRASGTEIAHVVFPGTGWGAAGYNTRDPKYAQSILKNATVEKVRPVVSRLVARRHRAGNPRQA